MKTMALWRGVILWALVSVGAQAQFDSWQIIPTGSTVSLRGIAAAARTDAQSPVIWLSGAQGTVLKSLDLGDHWQAIGPAGYAQVDFRALHAWDQDSAIIASAGTPAVVLKTSDGGQTWREVFRDERPSAFFDGLKFFDAQRGVLFGDPIDGRFCVFTTTDAGESWQAISANSLPQVLPGEAAFAASNSAMIVVAPSTILIGTGGADRESSRILRSDDFGQSWQVADCPLRSHASAGIFSLAVQPTTKCIVAVGGDYKPEAVSANTSAHLSPPAQSWVLSTVPCAGYRSAVVYSGGSGGRGGGFYATGPAGTDYSADGLSWRLINVEGFHALVVLPDQTLVATGANGKFGRSRSAKDAR